MTLPMHPNELREDVRKAVVQAVSEVRGDLPRKAPSREPWVDPDAPPLPPEIWVRPTVPLRIHTYKQSRQGKLVLWDDGVERNMRDSWFKLFKDNEVNKWTDDKLVEAMEELIPGHGFTISEINRHRGSYRRGLLNEPGKSRHSRVSHRYVESSDWLHQATSRGKAVKIVRPLPADPAGRRGPPFEKIASRRYVCNSCARHIEPGSGVIIQMYVSGDRRYHPDCAAGHGISWRVDKPLHWDQVDLSNITADRNGVTYRIVAHPKYMAFGCVAGEDGLFDVANSLEDAKEIIERRVRTENI